LLLTNKVHKNQQTGATQYKYVYII